MSNNTQKMELQSLSSLSIQGNLRELGASNIFPSIARKSSFDFVNIFKDSGQFNRKQVQNSLDLLNSNIGMFPKTLIQTKEVFRLNQQQKNRIQQAGVKPIQIGQAMSDSQQQFDEFQSSSRNLKFQQNFDIENYKPTQYLPMDLVRILQQNQIPLQYVKGLLLVKDQMEIKSVRRLKVQRYLQKRRNKTWNRKICYNCRQKVAEERLRIKGKFIKKRRAMQILGLQRPIPLAQLKAKLQHQLKDKTIHEIQEIIKKQK